MNKKKDQFAYKISSSPKFFSKALALTETEATMKTTQNKGILYVQQ